MTEPVCPTNIVSPNKEVCNECLMNGCPNCVDRCVDKANECSNIFSTNNKSLMETSSGVTQPVSFTNDEPTNPNLNKSFPGFEYVCDISPDQSSFTYQDVPINTEDNLNVSYKPNTYNGDGSFMVSVNYSDNMPTQQVSAGQVRQFQSKFNLDTVNDSFVLIQDTYRDNFKRYKEFHDSQSGLAPLELDLYSLRNMDPDSLARNLFNLVKDMYKIQALDIKNTNFDRKNKRQELANLRKDIDRHRVIIDDLKAVNATTKRNIEINLNKSRRVHDTNKVLMIVMIIVGFMIIIPILKKAGVMSLNSAMGLWCVLLVAVLVYMSYELYVKRVNMDEVEYRKMNFAKPTDKEIAKSRALAQMRDKDKARCQAFAELEEELDVPNINLDVSQYYSKTQVENKCANIPDSN